MTESERNEDFFEWRVSKLVGTVAISGTLMSVTSGPHGVIGAKVDK